MTDQILINVRRTLLSVKGKKCWQVDAGGSAGNSIGFHIGDKISLPPPVKTPKLFHPPSHEAEIRLLVWCAWRLDGLSSPISSSDQNPNAIKAALDVLVNQTIEAIDIRPPAWDANIRFSEAMEIKIFCHHIYPNPSYSENWHIRYREEMIVFGPGYEISIEEIDKPRISWRSLY